MSASGPVGVANGQAVGRIPAAGLHQHLTFARRKPRSIGISVAYRLVRLVRIVLGPQRALRLLLNAAWLFHRFAHEASIAVGGDEFRCTAFGLTPERLAAVIPQGGTVLDVGCGLGRWSRAAATTASRVVGVDYDAGLIAAARRRATESHIEFRVADITEPLRETLGDERFDVILLLHVLEHVERSGELLQEFSALGTQLIVEVPDFEADALNHVRLALGTRFYSDADHVREYTGEMLRDELETSGWHVTNMERRGATVVAFCVADSDVAGRARGAG